MKKHLLLLYRKQNRYSRVAAAERRGDVIEFVKRYYNLDFKGAVEMLAKEYGISLEGAFGGSRDKGGALRDKPSGGPVLLQGAASAQQSGIYIYEKQRYLGGDTQQVRYRIC